MSSRPAFWRLFSLASRIPSVGGTAVVPSRSLYIVPTGAGLLFGLILLTMLLGSLNYQNNLGLLFTFLAASIALVAMHHTWFNLLGLAISVRGGAPVFCGEEALFEIALRDSDRRPRADLQVVQEDVRGGPGEVAAGGETRLRLALPTTDRGRLAPPRLRLETRYPLGLFRAWCYFQNEAWVTVYPAPAARSLVPPPVPTYRQSANGDRGVGADDFLGLRGYRPGDSPRQLDWKAYGRERGLMVKQFGGDRADQIWLDWHQLPPVDPETRLRLLCRQVLDAAQADRNFGLRLPGQELPMGQGDRHKHRCLEALADFRHA